MDEPIAEEPQPLISVAVVDDDTVLLEHFKAAIESATNLELIWTASDLKAARHHAVESLPDVALIDLGLPDGDGAELIEMVQRSGHTKTLVVTVFDDRASVRRAISSGADGYLVKDSEPAAIVDAIESVAAGGAPLSASAAIHLMDLVRSQASGRPASDERPEDAPSLTVRELELLELFAKGLTYREAADCLGLSRHTVADYVKSIYRKLAVNSRAEAVFEAVHFRLIRLSDAD